MTDIYHEGTPVRITVSKNRIRSKTKKKIVFNRDNWKCVYCGKRLFLNGKNSLQPTIDHVVPRSQGGTHDISNLLTSCKKCNHKKSDKSFEEFVGALIWKIALIDTKE